MLNERILARIPTLQDAAVLELGAGNGYFAAMMRDRFSGQAPRRHVITDQSKRLLEIAERHFRLPGTEYVQLDVRAPFPFDDGAFDLVLATMVFNEITTAGVRRALGECRRVLHPSGRLLATVLHPEFVASLAKRGELRRERGRQMTMPGADGIRLPVVVRKQEAYERLLQASGFSWESEDVYATEEVLRAKPGLSGSNNVPLALIFDCRVGSDLR
ncbi:MAG: class I SAM-dependent methyltransferase [Pirellulaceae bacterium]